MATTQAVKAARAVLPRAVWVVAPPLCAAKVEGDAPLVKLLPSEGRGESPNAAAELQRLLDHKAADKTFKMHIGGNLNIPTRSARELPQPTKPLTRQQMSEIDPFEGLPFRGMAEKLGAAVLPAIKAAREAEREAKRTGKAVADSAEVFVPPVPHLLPFTRWAANSETFRNTFIADPPKQRPKVRLSWYHPDDTMVPRDWFTGGLLADIKHYMPFGLFGGSKA